MLICTLRPIVRTAHHNSPKALLAIVDTATAELVVGAPPGLWVNKERPLTAAAFGQSWHRQPSFLRFTCSEENRYVSRPALSVPAPESHSGVLSALARSCYGDASPAVISFRVTGIQFSKSPHLLGQGKAGWGVFSKKSSHLFSMAKAKWTPMMENFLTARGIVAICRLLWYNPSWICADTLRFACGGNKKAPVRNEQVQTVPQAM